MFQVSYSPRTEINFNFLTGHALFGDLSVINLLLQGKVTNQPVNVTGFLLTVAVHPTHGLGVMTRVPGGIEHDNAVRSNEIHTQATRSGRRTKVGAKMYRF